MSYTKQISQHKPKTRGDTRNVEREDEKREIYRGKNTGGKNKKKEKWKQQKRTRTQKTKYIIKQHTHTQQKKHKEHNKT